tara:strand:- start:510 stop:1283 length:774 start_codon:yes stop_codon:yes gene_type:complete
MSADLSLFPDINPNIEEIIKQQDAIDPDEVATQELPEKRNTHKEIFVPLKTKNKKLKREYQEKKSVSLVVIDSGDESSEEVPDNSPGEQGEKAIPIRKYAHLEKARAKGLVKRREKAEAKRLLKEKNKELKELEKSKRREATKERNRVKARERYRRLKGVKAEAKVEEKQDDLKVFKEVAPKNMSFRQFAKYMNQYEGVKKAYEVKRLARVKKSAGLKTQPVKTTYTPKPKKAFHPPNYPLAHLYNPANRNNEDFFL